MINHMFVLLLCGYLIGGLLQQHTSWPCCMLHTRCSVERPPMQRSPVWFVIQLRHLCNCRQHVIYK